MLNRRNLVSLSFILAGSFFISGCEGFFGKKTNTDFLDVPIYDNRQVAYVPIQPVWDQFVYPVDVIAGFDQLIYVADAGTNEIVSLDQSGNENGRFSIPGLKAIAQDRTLDILAIGTFDTIISSVNYTLTAIYRIEMKNGGGYGLKNATIQNKIVHPFYFKVSFKPADDASDVFSGIGIRGDNQYFVTRNGTNNSTLQFGGPDDAVLLFDKDDKFVTPIGVNTSAGLFLDYFKDPVSIVTIAQPPQTPFVSMDPDFVFASVNASTVLKVQYIDVQETENGTSYVVKEMVTGDTTKADNFLFTPGRFSLPADVTYTGDGTNFIFVLDQEKDSLFLFTNTGLEGVSPPAGSNATKNIRVSFGGTGTGLMQFSDPMGIAYFDRIVYVADAGNKRVLRYKLTTDFQ